ncbi:MAG: JAB domain-containing protein [Eubacteriales bacterium]
MNDSKSGHRLRLRNKFTESPPSLNETELLELILSYAIPRRDIQPLATELIINFGSLSSVLAADTSDLCKIKGISEYTAACLKLVAWVGNHYSAGQKTNSPPIQVGMKELLPTDIKEQIINPAKASCLESSVTLLAESTNTFETESEIKPVSKKSDRSGIHMFSKSLLREAIEILPRIPETNSIEDVRVFLNNNLHYSSEQTRMRYAHYIIRRLFPSGQVDLPILSFSRKYAGMQELRDVCFYRFCKAEPLMQDVIQNLLIPEYRSGSVTRTALRNFLKEKYPESKSAGDCAQAIVETLVAAGIAKADRTKFNYAYRDILLPSLAFILHSEFPGGMYYLNEVESCAAFKCLFWRQNQVKESLYVLRNMNLIPKISEIDNIRQVTISLELEQVVEKLDGRNPL